MSYELSINGEKYIVDVAGEFPLGHTRYHRSHWNEIWLRHRDLRCLSMACP